MAQAGSSSEFKVIGQNSCSEEEDVPFSAMGASYEVTYFTDARWVPGL